MVSELTQTQEQPEEPATRSEKAASAVISLSEYAGTSSDENPAPIQSAADSLPGAVKAPEAVLLPASGAALSDDDVPAFLRTSKTIADYRPNCLNPDACGASGLDHCYTCTKAMEAAESEMA